MPGVGLERSEPGCGDRRSGFFGGSVRFYRLGRRLGPEAAELEKYHFIATNANAPTTPRSRRKISHPRPLAAESATGGGGVTGESRTGASARAAAGNTAAAAAPVPP